MGTGTSESGYRNRTRPVVVVFRFGNRNTVTARKESAGSDDHKSPVEWAAQGPLPRLGLPIQHEVQLTFQLQVLQDEQLAERQRERLAEHLLERLEEQEKIQVEVKVEIQVETQVATRVQTHVSPQVSM